MNGAVNSIHDIKDLILKFEHDFPVDQWKINGIHIWPKIRFKLYIHLCEYVLKPNQKPVQIQQKNLSTTITRSNVTQWWNDFKEFILLTRQIKDNKLVFFGHSMHKVLRDSLLFNRFFDSMIDHHNLYDTAITFDFDKLVLPVHNRSKTIDLTAAVRHYRRVKRLKEKFFNRAPVISNISVSHYDAFFTFCENQTWFTHDLGLDLNAVTSWTKKIKNDLAFYKWCFLKADCQKVIFVSYYGFDSTASAIVAANDLNIETVEFQHGPITHLHMAYSHWTKVPDAGFNTMPLTYWVWDKYTALNFENWIQPPNKTVVVHQPWLGYSLKNNGQDKTVHTLNIPKVLYTLQLLSLSTLEEVFPPALVEAMRLRDYHFLLRFHPRNRHEKETYINYLKGQKVPRSKYSFQDPKRVPLSDAMVNSAVHITLWSGSLLEAILLNLPTIIFHEIGLMHYDNYLDDDLVEYANPATNELLKKLDLFIKNDNQADTNQIIYNPLDC